MHPRGKDDGGDCFDNTWQSHSKMGDQRTVGKGPLSSGNNRDQSQGKNGWRVDVLLLVGR